MSDLGSMVEITSHKGCSAAGVVWTLQGQSYVTAIAKTTLRLVADGDAVSVEPEPLVPDEVEQPPGYLYSAGELAPIVPRAEILVVGQASGDAAPAERACGQLVYWRGDAVLVSKSVVVEPAQGGRVALARGLGPLPATAAERVQCLGGREAPKRSAGPLELPTGMYPGFFQAAPRDQLLDEIAAGDGLLLENLVAGNRRLVTRLPAIVAQARLLGPTAGAARQVRVAMRADTLIIMLDRGICSVVLRGHVPIHGATAAHRLLVELSVRSSGGRGARAHVATPFEGKAPRGAPPPIAEALARLEGGASTGETAAVDPAALAKLHAALATPFDGRQPQTQATAAAASPASAPQSEQPSEPWAQTETVDPRVLAKLRAAPPTPFTGLSPRPIPPPPPSWSPNDPAPDSQGQTSAVDPAVLARLRSMAATPFGQAPPRTPPAGIEPPRRPLPEPPVVSRPAPVTVEPPRAPLPEPPVVSRPAPFAVEPPRAPLPEPPAPPQEPPPEPPTVRRPAAPQVELSDRAQSLAEAEPVDLDLPSDE